MTIIEIDPTNGIHIVESQSHRTDVWMDGYIEVPPYLEATALASGGYCDLIIDGGVLVGITPTGKPEPDPTAEISALKSELAATDYQIIKCSEYQLYGLELPYDLAALHESRQAIRDQINRLEAGDE